MNQSLTRLLRVALVAAVLIGLPLRAQAQTSVQLAQTVLAYSQVLCTAGGATPTCSFTPTGFSYVTKVTVELACGTTTCTAIAATTTATANLGGWTILTGSTGSGAAAGTGFLWTYDFTTSPLKSVAANTLTSVGALPAVTNGTWRVNVFGWTNNQ